MKQLLAVTCIIAGAIILNFKCATAQQQFNLPLLSNWDDESVPAAWTGPFNECWGYAANGREYAFLGSTQGTYFFDVTNPSTPVVIDFVRTKDTTTLVVNKDYAVYTHYLYAVSDQGDNSLQIFDLQYLPDSVVKVYDDNVISRRCHNVVVDKDRLYMCSNTRPGNTFGAMDIMSLSNPINPVLLGTVEDPGFYGTHDVYVKNDTVYCSNGYSGLWIYDVKFPATPSLISIIDLYPENGYNHNSYVSSDSKTLVFTDENHGLSVKIFDITDVHDAQQLSLVRSNLLMVPDSLSNNGSVAHNVYLRNNIMLVSYYHDGVQVYYVGDPSNPVLIGYYDTCPENTNYSGYTGCWGLYPFLPSGNIIASDIHNGLFMLEGDKVFNYGLPPLPTESTISFGATPVIDELNLFYSSTSIGDMVLEIFDATGRKVAKRKIEFGVGSGTFTYSAYSMASGIYIARVSSSVKELNKTLKFLKADY